MADEKLNSLTDAELGGVNGGMGANNEPSASGRKIKNSRGYTVGEESNGSICYWPCPKCGKPTFARWTALHCEPCDDWWWGLDKSTWTGTEAELVAIVG